MSYKVITVAQQKGGAGKTTLAAHLAVTWSQQRKRVAVIDIDPQGSLSEWHRIRARRFGPEYTGISFSQLSGWRLGTEITRYKKDHDIILVDSPPHMETEARTAIRFAHFILIPVQPSPTDLWATQATVNLAKQERLPYLTVLNRVTANSRLADQFSGELERLAQTRIGNRVAFASSLLEGKSVTEAWPQSAASSEIKALAKEVWECAYRQEKARETVLTPVPTNVVKLDQIRKHKPNPTLEPV